VQDPTEKPPWDPNDKEASLERYASWLNAIARGAFHQDGRHPETVFFVRETGDIEAMMFRDHSSREERNALIRKQASEIKPFGTIRIIITKIYHPKLVSPGFKGVKFAGASSPDSHELEADCLIVQMLSKSGKEKSWINPILYDGDQPVLGDTVEMYPEDD
jgi:hypothetical protein